MAGKKSSDETIGKATIEIEADVTGVRRDLEELERIADRVRSGRPKLAWPDVGAVTVVFSFIGFVIEKIVG